MEDNLVNEYRSCTDCKFTFSVSNVLEELILKLLRRWKTSVKAEKLEQFLVKVCDLANILMEIMRSVLSNTVHCVGNSVNQFELEVLKYLPLCSREADWSSNHQNIYSLQWLVCLDGSLYILINRGKCGPADMFYILLFSVLSHILSDRCLGVGTVWICTIQSGDQTACP